jgi:type I restriction enzyme M protein
MNGSPFKDIDKLEADLWSGADNLRANSKLTSCDYFTPVLPLLMRGEVAV